MLIEIERGANSLLFAAFPVAMVSAMSDLVGAVSLPTFLLTALVLAAQFLRTGYKVVVERKQGLAAITLAAIMLAAMIVHWLKAGDTTSPWLFVIAFLIWVNIVWGMNPPDVRQTSR